MRTRSVILLATAGFMLAPILTPISSAINSNAGTAAYTFLKIGTGAKSQALGGAFVGLADDATALYYNPAGLTVQGVHSQIFDEPEYAPDLSTPLNRFTASYINYLVDFQYGFIGYARKLDTSTAIGVSVSYLNYGTFNRLDREGANLGTFGASDLAIGLTYSKRFAPRFSAGVTGKFIYEKVEEYSSSGMAADIGLMYLLSDQGTTRIGLALSNLGAQLNGLSETNKDKLPTRIAAGISHQLVGLPLIFSGEAGKPFDNNFYFALGAEFISLKPFFIRFGWNSQGLDHRTGDDNDTLAGFAGGFGITYKNYQVDYSYSSYADLGAVHRISLGTGF